MWLCPLLAFPPWQQRDKAKWEVMWVLFIEVAAYGSNTISADAEHVTFKPENGTTLPLESTCPLAEPVTTRATDLC